jgi:HAD superfamily hydrolase (TIGR01490 family)
MNKKLLDTVQGHSRPGQSCAFFDVDGTLIRIKSMFSFSDFLVRQLAIEAQPHVILYRQTLQAMFAAGAPREELNAFYYTLFKGLSVELISQLGRRWYQEYCPKEVFFEAMLDVVREHQAMGQRIVLVSGSFEAVLRPLAEELGITDLICAPLEVRPNGCYSGNLTGPSTIGEGKAQGIRAFAEQHQVDLSHCFAYGDDISDFPMLDQVGTAVVVNPDPALLDSVEQRQWHFIRAN